MEETFANVAKKPQPMFRAEQEVIGFDHSAVGASLMRRGQLPGSLEEVVRYHHIPQNASRYRQETCVIHIADAVAHAMQCGSSGELFVPPVDEEAWNLLGLNPGYLPQIFDLVDRQLEGVVKMFHSSEL